MRKKANHAASKIEEEKKAIVKQELDNKYKDYVSVKEHKKMSRKQRRESLIQRGIISNIQKMSEMEKKRKLQEDEHANAELKRQEAVDVKCYQEQLKKKQRDSLIGRHELWRNQMKVEENMMEMDKEKEKKDYEDKEMDWKAIQEYKEQQEKALREEVRRQNEYYFTVVRGAEEAEAIRKNEEEAMEKELARQEREDVANYRNNMKQNRRQSLANKLYVIANQQKQYEDTQVHTYICIHISVYIVSGTYIFIYIISKYIIIMMFSLL